MRNHLLLDREASEAIARRNAAVLARVDREVRHAAGALLAFVLAVLGALALLHFFTPCEAGHLCAGALGLVRSGSKPEDEAFSDLQTKVQDAVTAARAAGELDGEKLGFIQGTRYGICVGAVYGFLFGAATIIACLLAGLHKGYGL
jgi:hypothetical protein